MENLLEGFRLIGRAFVEEPSIWWFLAPVFILWIGMEIYFGQYKKERLGWNSALANSISFTWINIAAFRVLFMEDIMSDNFWLRFGILALFFIYGMIAIYIAFFHKASPRVAAFLAGPTRIYFLSTVSILWGQGILAINQWVFLDLLFAYIVLSFLFWVIRRNLGILGEVEAVKNGEKPIYDEKI
jgi:hypothetical protein